MAPAEPNALPFQVKGTEPDFPEEREGWEGYIEWERYPEKKKQAAEILAQYDFLLYYHYALGKTLKDMPRKSWDYVKKEKSEDMIHVLQFPYNAKNHFVRNHGGIPKTDPSKYFFEVEGLVNQPGRNISLAALQDESLFPRMETAVTLQCSGTRRIEQIHDYPGDGDELINAPWGEGAIGTARYVGVSLKKVLKYCGGVANGGQHIESFGADSYFQKGHVYNYAVSVPLRKAKVNQVMLAWEMNGRALPALHGAPLRVVVMGYIGARSCKWLTRINVLADPSLAPVQMKEYLYYTPQMGKHNVTYSNGFSIQTMPVASAIMTPVDKDVIVHDGTIKLTGWAYSGSGWPERVEVSNDGGGVWYEVPYENLSTKYFHAWRTWWMEIPVDAEGWLEFCVRCWDDALNTQPTFVRSAWNWHLHVTSSCHRVKLYSVNKSEPQTAKRLKQLEDHGASILPLTRPVPFDLQTDEAYMEEMKKRGGRDPIE